MTELLLGPVLRHVGEHDATVWVETSAPGTVEVLGHHERTWTVAGHHYALVEVTDLPPASHTPYDVRVDGEVVWPRRGDPHPPPAIRTIDPERTLRVVFGSCRHATPRALRVPRSAADALDAYARRLLQSTHDAWPDALVLLGDQVYADETSPGVQRRIAAHRDLAEPPGVQVRDFEEYTWLYAESWTDPQVRWLLSTVPSSMIFDDHDVIDDWNTSAQWRREMQPKPWWRERIVGALASYWVYQHLGNLSPADLAGHDLYQRVRAHDGDAEPLLREFAAAADREADGAKGARWSYRRDFGRTRLLVIDSRCGRMLDSEGRSMVSSDEFAWIDRQLDGEVDHLLVGTSLPWLLPRALHDLEAWNEALADGSHGPRVTRWSERLRRSADLEHWAAFRDSFRALADLFRGVGAGHRSPSGRPPATICVLSGDVHHAYVARARLGREVASRVYQLTCSPLRNYVPWPVQQFFRWSWLRSTEHVMRFVLSRLGPVPLPGLDWEPLGGPYFGNQIGTLTLDGRRAELRLEQAALQDGRPVVGARGTTFTLS